MKFTKIYNLIFPVFIFLFATVFLSCGGGGGGGGGIFAAIESEVPLNKVSVPNVVKTVVVHNGNLYCTNGDKLFYKGIESGPKWNSADRHYSSRLALLASDAANLYVMTEDGNVYVWCNDAPVATGAIVILDNQYVSNNGVANREAFVVTSSDCRRLNGTGVPTASGGSSSTRGAVWNNGLTVFVNTTCITSNFSYTHYWTPSSQIVLGGSTIESFITPTNDGNIRSIAYTMEGGTEYILIATDKTGYKKIRCADGIKVDVHSNGNQFDTFPIFEDGIWVMPNSANTETRAIFASIVSPADKTRYGLWGFYKGSSWNLE